MESMNYWLGELANKAPATRMKYQGFFEQFCTFANKTPNNLIEQRRLDLKAEDPREQKAIECLLKAWMVKLRDEEYSPATLQIAFASIKSFFEANEYPLRTKKSDYPKGDSLGSRVITREVIRKILDDAEHTRLKRKVRALVMFLKDTGFRVSDAIKMNYGDIAEGLERGDSFISIQIITQKNKTTAKTFIGAEAIEAIKEYLAERRKGSQRRLTREYIHPEAITRNSPLFRTNEIGAVKRITRGGVSNILNFHCQRTGEKKLSAHSFRKHFQTQLEAAGVPTNWIDQMIGHKLAVSRDAYSLPNDEQLLGVYQKAYSQLRVYPERVAVEIRIGTLEAELENKNREIAELKSNGSQKATELESLSTRFAKIEEALKVKTLEKKISEGQGEDAIGRQDELIHKLMVTVAKLAKNQSVTLEDVPFGEGDLDSTNERWMKDQERWKKAQGKGKGKKTQKT